MDILAELDHFADLRDQQAILNLKRNELRDVVLAPITLQLAEIDAEMAPMFENVGTALQDTELRVKSFTLEAGASIKGDRLMVVYAKGRTSWDGKRLDGYATAHPEITAFRTVGDPSVSIRNVK